MSTHTYSKAYFKFADIQETLPDGAKLQSVELVGEEGTWLAEYEVNVVPMSISEAIALLDEAATESRFTEDVNRGVLWRGIDYARIAETLRGINTAEPRDIQSILDDVQVKYSILQQQSYQYEQALQAIACKERADEWIDYLASLDRKNIDHEGGYIGIARYALSLYEAQGERS